MTIDPSKIKTAKEWADTVLHYDDTYGRGENAAAEVIDALPDTIVDGDKLREVINAQLDSHPHGTAGHQVAVDLACELQDLLPAPALPTLAELIEQGSDLTQYQWMQCKVQGIANPRALLNIWDYGCYVVTRRGTVIEESLADVTPLPDLPKLEWPGQEPRTDDIPPGETVDNPSSGHRADPRPGEAWLVDYGDGQTVALLRKTDYTDDEPLWFTDEGAGYTLDWANPVARMVPEHPIKTVTTAEEYEALPEGSIVAHKNTTPAIKLSGGFRLFSDQCTVSSAEMARIPRHVLREGWGS